MSKPIHAKVAIDAIGVFTILICVDAGAEYQLQLSINNIKDGEASLPDLNAPPARKFQKRPL